MFFEFYWMYLLEQVRGKIGDFVKGVFAVFQGMFMHVSSASDADAAKRGTVLV